MRRGSGEVLKRLEARPISYQEIRVRFSPLESREVHERRARAES